MSNLDVVTSKIIPAESLSDLLANWKQEGKKIVFTNGCFDIVHMGHVDYLSKAADQGDVLLVGLNTDASVKRLKGSNRPVNDQKARSLILASLFFVSAIVLFDEDTPYDLIKKVQPDVLVKGSDYRAEDIVGYDIVKAKNGEIITIDFVQGYSTTEIINKLMKK